MTDATRLAALTDEFVRTVLHNPYIPIKFFPKQAQFLLFSDTLEVLYGGAAMSGKTFAVLGAAAQYATVPGYEAIIFRNTEGDLKQAKGLIQTSMDWWYNRRDMRWNGNDLTWTFPSGAHIRFDYMNHEEHAARHRGSSYQTIIWDELTLIREEFYRFLFRSLRRPNTGAISRVPLRVRGATNPGGISHIFVRDRFIPDEYMDEPDEDVRFSKLWWKYDRENKEWRLFVPAWFKDNPHVDQEEYVRSLMQMDPIQRAQQMGGDWRDFSGGRFQADWFKKRRFKRHGDFFYTDGGDPRGVNKNHCPVYVVVDSAISERSRSDFTAAGAFAVTPDKDLLVLGVLRRRLAVDKMLPVLAQFACDHKAQWVGVESDNTQRLITDAARKTPGMPPVRALYTRNVGKLHRAVPAILLAERYKILLPERDESWAAPFLAELLAFTGDPKKDLHDDIPDMLSWGVDCMRQAGPFFATTAPVPVPEDRRLEDRSRRHTDRGIFGRGR